MESNAEIFFKSKPFKISGIPSAVLILQDIKKMVQNYREQHDVDAHQTDLLVQFLCWWQKRAEKYYSDVTDKFLKCWTIWKKEKESSIRAKALQILRKTQPLQRTPEQISHLKEMCEYFGFAQGIPEESFHKFCQNLEYREYQHDEIIFLQGDKPQQRLTGKFFMQIEGTVEFFAIADSGLETLREECSVAKRKKMSSEVLREKLGTSVFVRHVGPFGELALITGQSRTASAIVTDWARIVTCTMEIFKECLLVHQRDKMQLNAKIHFLESMRMLKGWTKPKIMRLAYDLKLKEFGPGDVVFQQGDKTTKVALVCGGEGVLQKKAVWDDSARKGSVTSDAPIKITNVRAGTMIGDIEVLNRLPTYLYTTCIPTNGSMSAYLMSVGKFRTHFVYENQSTLDFIQEIADLHKRFYEQKVENTQNEEAVEQTILPKVKKADSFAKLFEKTGHDLNKMPTRKRLNLAGLQNANGDPGSAVRRSLVRSESTQNKSMQSRITRCESCPPMMNSERLLQIKPQEFATPRKAGSFIRVPRDRARIVTLPTIKVTESETDINRSKMIYNSGRRSAPKELEDVRKMTEQLHLLNTRSEARSRAQTDGVHPSKFMFASNSKIQKTSSASGKYSCIPAPQTPRSAQTSSFFNVEKRISSANNGNYLPIPAPQTARITKANSFLNVEQACAQKDHLGMAAPIHTVMSSRESFPKVHKHVSLR